MRKVYFDSAATTQVRDEVIDAMHIALKEYYGNPSSTHSFGRACRTMVEKARKTIAKQLNAHPSEIIFTSGGTEADNMILRCAVRDLGVKTIITSPIEHHAVLHTAEQLAEECGITLHMVKLDQNGNVDLNHLEELLSATNEKKLVSLMHVNNEIGNLLPIDVVAELCKQYDALFHSDTVQSIGHFEWDVQKTKVDFMAAAAHKFHGPKGIGFAYIRRNTGLNSLIFGGGQERGFRAGTESFHNIIGLENAFTLAYDNLAEERDYVLGLKKHFIKEIKKAIPEASFNGLSGDLEKSTYTLVNVSLPFTPEKAMLLLFNLDLKGIACSKGSACQSGSSAGSHVLNAVVPKDKMQQPSLRFSFSKFNTKEEIDYAVATLKELIES